MYHMQPLHAITISDFQSFSCAHACFMGIVLPYKYVYLPYAATACNYHFWAPVLPLCPCMLLSCHPMSNPFSSLCSFALAPSTFFRGLLMESDLHHLAGQHVSIEQQRSWSLPPQSPSTSIFIESEGFEGGDWLCCEYALQSSFCEFTTCDDVGTVYWMFLSGIVEIIEAVRNR